MVSGTESRHGVRQEVAMNEEKDFYLRLAERGITRRDFMKFCGFLTATSLGVKSLLNASSEKNISAGTTSLALSQFAIDCQSG